MKTTFHYEQITECKQLKYLVNRENVYNVLFLLQYRLFTNGYAYHYQCLLPIITNYRLLPKVMHTTTTIHKEK